MPSDARREDGSERPWGEVGDVAAEWDDRSGEGVGGSTRLRTGAPLADDGAAMEP